MIKEKDRVLILFSGNSYGSVGDTIKKALELLNVQCFVKDVLVNPDETARFIIENKINSIVGIPMQVLYFSRIHSEIFKNYIEKVLLSGDYVPEVFISELKFKYGCKVFTHYGSSEMGYGGGVECEALDGYHLREADLYFEIINCDTGKTAKDEEYGEMVFTTLTRSAMPLIRYKTGDIASFSQNACACGTFLKTMKRSLGRIDNRIELRKNQFIYLRELDEIILNYEEVLDYKSSVDKENTLVIEIMTQNREVFQNIKEKIAKKIRRFFYNKFGRSINVNLIQSQENKPLMGNSMIKRKILDERKEDDKWSIKTV
jgi:phenylacetate-coenzyme A ligase PaaK-like adenylate-forming protein